jgi:hypothetical protein
MWKVLRFYSLRKDGEGFVSCQCCFPARASMLGYDHRNAIGGWGMRRPIPNVQRPHCPPAFTEQVVLSVRDWFLIVFLIRRAHYVKLGFPLGLPPSSRALEGTEEGG